MAFYLDMTCVFYVHRNIITTNSYAFDSGDGLKIEHDQLSNIFDFLLNILFLYKL